MNHLSYGKVKQGEIPLVFFKNKYIFVIIEKNRKEHIRMENIQKNFFKLFQFENRIKDELANYFSITDGFLWRRDLTRMVAMKIAEDVTGHYDYDFRDIGRETIKKIEVGKEMELHLETSERKIVLQPLQKTKPFTLQYVLRSEQEFETEVSMSVKTLKQVLMICEQKWMLEKEEDPKIIFDFNEGTIKMKDREEVFSMPVEEVRKKNDVKIIYSFHLLKDMIYNKYKEYIFFRISKHYSVLEYEKNIYGAIMHAQ